VAGQEGYKICGWRVLYQGKICWKWHRKNALVKESFWLSVSVGVGRQQHLLPQVRPQRDPRYRESGWTRSIFTGGCDKMNLLELRRFVERRVWRRFAGGEKSAARFSNGGLGTASGYPRRNRLGWTSTRIVASGVNKLKRPDNAQLVITLPAPPRPSFDAVHIILWPHVPLEGQLGSKKRADWITKHEPQPA
jgi:hypothetical protein